MICWQQVILNLRRVKSLHNIARSAGSNVTHLNRIARGEVAEPRFNTGVKLLDLHYDYCHERHNSGILI